MINQDQFYSLVDRLLWEEWDPLAVNDHDGAIGEYSGYIPVIVELLKRNASAGFIAQHLSEIVTKQMSMWDNPDHNMMIAQKLKQLWIDEEKA